MLFHLSNLCDCPISPIYRCTSLVHSLIVGSLGAYVLFVERKLDMESVWAATNLSTLTMAISAGYFLWDSIVVLVRYDLFGFLFALHGIYCLYVYAAATFVRYSKLFQVVYCEHKKFRVFPLSSNIFLAPSGSFYRYTLGLFGSVSMSFITTTPWRFLCSNGARLR